MPVSNHRRARLEQDYVANLRAQNLPQYGEKYAAGSAQASAELEGQFDVPYGAHRRNKVDVFTADNAHLSPAILFFHGGYWRAGSKEERRFLAREWVGAGTAFVVANYRLAPGASMLEIVQDAQDALAFLHDQAPQFGIDRRKIVVAGNSAGAHLAAMSVAGDIKPCGLCLLSGLYDLRPLTHTSLAGELNLTSEAARLASPFLTVEDETPTAIFVGERETSAFKAQSSLYHWARRAHGHQSVFQELGELDHFSIIAELGRRESAIGRSIEKFIGR